MLRANLPVLAPDAPLIAGVALGSDALDGALARALGDETAFGGYCDALADVAFWTWFASRWETSTALRRVAVASLVTPLVAVVLVYFARGRAVEYPRPVAARNAQVALQVVLMMRALLRTANGGTLAPTYPASDAATQRPATPARKQTEKR